MLVRSRVDQLRRDPHRVADPANRPFHDRVDVQDSGDFRRRRPLRALELHHRAARDDAKLADGCEVGRQLVGHPFGEVVLVGIARVVVERQHGNRSNHTGRDQRRRRAEGRAPAHRTRDQERGRGDENGESAQRQPFPHREHACMSCSAGLHRTLPPAPPDRRAHRRSTRGDARPLWPADAAAGA